MQFCGENGILTARLGGETLRIEPWGKDSLRVRATRFSKFTDQDWALIETPEKCQAVVEIGEEDHWVGDGTIDKKEIASITNGRIKAVVNFRGIITYYRDGKQFLREYFRFYDGTLCKESRCLKVVNREWKGVIGGSEYQLNVKFESNDGEKIFGMGQYQQPYMDLKGCVLELAQRNSQISVPFAVSSLGYGMLWNNPAIGEATFGKNYTEWTARSTKQMDYWLTVADGPKQIVENYTAVTGRAPMFPEVGWVCGSVSSVPHPGGSAFRGKTVPEGRYQDRSDRHRFLPLDRAGRLEIRQDLLAGSQGYGGRAPFHGNQSHRFRMAFRGPQK